MIALLRTLRVLMALAAAAAFLSSLSALSLLPDSSWGGLFSKFHIQAALLGLLSLVATAFSPTGGGGQGGFRGAALSAVLLGAALSAIEPLPAPAWTTLVLAALMPGFLLLDWFWSPPPLKTGFGVAALWLLYPAAYLGWALSQTQRPYALLDPLKAGGETAVSQHAAAFLLSAALASFALVALVRLRQKDGPDTGSGYRPPKGLPSRDQAGHGPR